MAKQAVKGGEVGVNGEFYEGGQFLPRTDKPKGSKRPISKGKQCVAPYEWSIPPSPTHFSIFSLIADSRGCERLPVWEWDGDKMKVLRTDYKGYISHGFFVPLYDLIEAFNAGERWVDTAEFQLYTPNIW